MRRELSSFAIGSHFRVNSRPAAEMQRRVRQRQSHGCVIVNEAVLLLEG
jgi:hypothetical protein